MNKIIEESGSTENGSYIKFSEGTMICYYTYSSSNRNFDGSDVNGIRYCTDTLWFPQQFTSTPTVTASTFIDGYCGFVGRINAESTLFSVMLCIVGNVDITRNIEITYTAIGRWK